MRWQIWGEVPTGNDLNCIEDQMTLEQLQELKKFNDQLISCFPFKDIKDRLLAEKFFRMGMIAGKTEFYKEKL